MLTVESYRNQLFDCLYVIFQIVFTYCITAIALILRGDSNIQLQLAAKFGKSPKCLKKKVVWITGASSGIGESLAYELATAGCRLILSDINPELEIVKQKCIDIGGLNPDDVMAIHLDMVAFGTHQSAVDEVMSKFGKIDILVNNAGRGQVGNWYKTSLEVYQQLLNVNVVGVLSLTKRVLPHMIKRNEGHIVNTSSIAGKLGLFRGGAYAGTKHAIQGWFDSLRLELDGTGISVTNVCPGYVFTNLLDTAFTENPNEKLKIELNQRKCMSTRRCAQLYAIAIANKMAEVWISSSPDLLLLYLNVYFPVVGKFLRRTTVWWHLYQGGN